MASCSHIVLLVFLSLIDLSKAGTLCNNYLQEMQKNLTMTQRISLIRASSSKEVIECTLWNMAKGKTCGPGETLACIVSDCYKDINLTKTCSQKTAMNETIYKLHFWCLLVKLKNVSSGLIKECDNFDAEIKTVKHLLDTLSQDPTSPPPTTSNSPPTRLTSPPTTSISPPTTSTSPPNISTTSPLSTSTTNSPSTSTISPPNISTSPPNTFTASPPSTATTSLPSTSVSPPTRSTSPPSTSTSPSSTSTSPPSTSTSPLSTWTRYSPTTSTTSPSNTFTASPQTTSTTSPPTSTTSPPTTSTTSTKSVNSTSARSPSTTLQKTGCETCPACACKHTDSPATSGNISEQKTETWKANTIIILFALSIICNFIQLSNHFLQRRRPQMRRMGSLISSNPECISLNPAEVPTEKCPEQCSKDSNGTVH